MQLLLQFIFPLSIRVNVLKVFFKQAIICGKVGQAPVQKILRNGRTVTIFTVGTGGMFDQRIVGGPHLPRPAQWHRIAVHNEFLGAYAVQQLMKEYSPYATEPHIIKKFILV